MQKVMTTLLILLVSSGLLAQTSDYHEARPPLRVSNLLGEVVLGELAGVTGYLAGLGIGNLVLSKRDGWFPSNQAFSVASAAAIIAIPAGVCFAGNNDQEQGSYFAALAGTIAGAGLCYLAKSPASAFVLPLSGSIVAYHFSRHYSSVNTSSTYDPVNRNVLLVLTFVLDP